MSKLGVGLLAGYDPNDLNEVRDGGLNVMLLQEHADQLPKTIKLCPYPAIRSFHKDGGFSPDQKADRWLEHGEKQMQLSANAKLATDTGKRLWVAGPNEVEISEVYGRFEAERALLCQGIGARAIVMNAGVGRTTKENVAAFYRGFNEVVAGQEVEYVIGVHEYGYIWPWTWMGKFQGENINPEKYKLPPIPKPGEEAFLIGRLQHVGLPEDVPVMITETGLDVVTSERWNLPKRKNGQPFGGWRTCTVYWKQYFDIGWAKMYGRLLQWTHAYYSQFPQIKAMYVFGLGPHHDDNFAAYDIGATDHVIPMMIESKPPVPDPPQDGPTPGPPQPPDPDTPPEPPAPTPNPPPGWFTALTTPAVWSAFFTFIRVAVKAAGRNPDPVMRAIWTALE